MNILQKCPYVQMLLWLHICLCFFLNLNKLDRFTNVITRILTVVWMNYLTKIRREKSILSFCNPSLCPQLKQADKKAYSK